MSNIKKCIRIGEYQMKNTSSKGISNSINKYKNEENYAINFYKILFIIIIALHHSHWCASWLKRGYLGVEFFFIVSGYFMYLTYFKNAKTNNKLNGLKYTKKRLTKLYPHYLFSFVIIYFVKYGSASIHINNLIKSIPEILLIQNIGIFPGGINYPLWYLSVLVVGGGIIYAILNRFGIKITTIIAMLCIAAVYIYLIFINKRLESWHKIYIFYIPFWRGVADIYIGILIGIFYTRIEECSFAEKISKYKYLIWVFEIVASIGILVSLISTFNLDFIGVFSIVILMICILNPHSLSRIYLNWKWTHKFINIQYPMYLNHAVVIWFLKILFEHIKIGIPNFVIVICYLLTLILYSVLTDCIVNKIKMFFNNKNNQGIKI